MKTQLIKVGNFLYRVRCEEDYLGGFAIYVNSQLVADVDNLPSNEELKRIIQENIKLETKVKSGFAALGVFE